MTETVWCRRFAGLLLLWSVIPLPFLYIVQVPFWAVAAVVAATLVAWPSHPVRLSPLVQNLLGVAILGAVIVAGGVRVGPLRPLGHLLLLLAAVRAVQVVDRRSLARLLPPAFLVWLVSVTASTHIAVVPFFAASTIVWWWVGMQVHLQAMGGGDGRFPTASVRPRHAAAAAIVALVLAAPVFLAMPRLRSPWIAGRGGVRSVTGFSSSVQLSGVGTIRQSREQAVLVRAVDGGDVDPSWTRLRGTAFERVTVDSWVPRRADESVDPVTGLIWLDEGERQPGDAAELEITVWRNHGYLFVPTSAVAVESPIAVRTDPAGGLVVAEQIDGPLRYTVWVTRGEIRRALGSPQNRGPRLEIDPELRQLAERITEGAAEISQRATRVESYLQREYAYSMRGMGRIGPDPVKWFLLRSRAGHCEYFAGGMVALLEAIGESARMVGGYSGGTVSPDGDEVMMREANAHAWVEVWLGVERGWQAFDPTPAAGVPRFGRVTGAMRIRMAWEWLQAGWDRYVLTYGLGEQIQLLAAAGDWLARMTAQIRIRHLAAIGGLLVVSWLLAEAVRRVPRRRVRRPRRRRPPAAHAIERLRRWMVRSGVSVPAGATVGWIGRAASLRWPEVAPDLLCLVRWAEQELYSASGARARPAAVGRLWSRVRRQIRAPVRPVIGNR